MFWHGSGIMPGVAACAHIISDEGVINSISGMAAWRREIAQRQASMWP